MILYRTRIKSTQMCGLMITGVRLQLAVPLVSMKREWGEAGYCGGLWHSGYGRYSQTPWFESLNCQFFSFPLPLLAGCLPYIKLFIISTPASVYIELRNCL